MRFRTLLASSVCLAAIAATQHGHAQSASESQLAQAGRLEEIVVTARKREESIQDVPIAITAFSEAEFERLQARDLRDLSSIAPSVVINPVGGIPGGAGISIRGIGTFEIEKTNEPSVGVTLDGVFIGSNTNALLNAFDIDRVEILRGPQGVLFGRNTTAGLINVVRSRPDQGELDVKASATVGSFEQRDFRGRVLAPLGEQFAIKLSGYSLQDDGFYDNLTLNRDAGGRDYLGFGAGARWWPNDDLDIYLFYERLEDNSELGTTRNAAVPGLGLACDVFGECFTNDLDDDDNRNIRNDQPGENEAIIDAITLEANWVIGEGTLTSITGWRSSDEDRQTDADASQFRILPFRRIQTEEQFSQEVRYAWSGIDNMELTLGGYFFTQEIFNETRNIGLFPFLSSIGAVPLGFSDDYYTGSQQDQETTALAAFFSADIDVTDRLRFSLGGRYSYEEKEFEGRNAELSLSNGELGGFGTIFVAPGVGVPGGGFGRTEDGSDSWTEFTPKLVAEYDLTPDVLGYISYARGFKSGGYNIRVNAEVELQPGDEVPSYDPETVNTYEIGIKSDLMNNRLRLNGAAYYNDYQDKQEQIIAPNPADDGQTSITIIENAADVTGYGFEFEGQALLTDAFSVRAALGYNKIEYDEFTADINGDGNVTDNTDLDLVVSPEWTWSLGGAYEQEIGPGTFFANANYRYTGDHALDLISQRNGRSLVDAYGILDASVAYTWDFNDVEITGTFFGRNLTDETYPVTFFQIATVSSFVAVNAPRTWGFELLVRY